MTRTALTGALDRTVDLGGRTLLPVPHLVCRNKAKSTWDYPAAPFPSSLPGTGQLRSGQRDRYNPNLLPNAETIVWIPTRTMWRPS
jgi:hypothetical protein